MLTAPDVPRILEIKTNIDETTYTAVLDTGSSWNYISDSVVKKHALTTKLTRSLKAQLVNGDMVTTDKEAEFKIKVKKDKEEEYSVCAKILPNMNTDIILGMDFLLSNKVKIDFESMKLEIKKI
ncbi:hypothetical protein DMUE_2868 [Dictyocoela muelleri]|nr:hypothetical protein DMUE_2868 [Dictyocoela muelleri]